MFRIGNHALSICCVYIYLFYLQCGISFYVEYCKNCYLDRVDHFGTFAPYLYLFFGEDGIVIGVCTYCKYHCLHVC